MTERSALRRRGVELGILLAYGAVAVGITWPLAARLSTHLLRGSGDTLFHYWNDWWVQRALAAGQIPFYTRYLFYPAGVSLIHNNFAWLNIAIGLVLRPLVGGLAAYNLPLLLNLALCGFTAFLLTRDLTGDWRAAFLAGLIYQCWPYRLHQLGHPNLISTQWIPLFLLFTIRTVRQGRWQDGALAGAFLALTGYTRWQQLIPAAIVGCVYLVCTLPGQWASWRRWMSALLLAGSVAALALAPPATLLMGQQITAPANLVVEQDESLKQTDLLAYLTPSQDHPVLGPLAQTVHDRHRASGTGPRPFTSYIGVAVLALALLGVWKGRRSAIPWAAIALVLISLALGPVLRVGGQLYPAIPMPYRLAARLFVVRLLRFPDRFNMFLALPVAALAAFGVERILGLVRRWGTPVTTSILCLVGATILFDYWIAPIPLEPAQPSPYYSELAAEPGDFAVLNLPIDPNTAKSHMFAQTVHHRPILQGHVSRLVEGACTYLDGHPWLRVLRQYSEMNPQLSDVSRQLGSLAEEDVRYIIVHKRRVGADRVAHWQRYLLTSPRFEDEQIVVYATTPLAGRDFTLADELAPGIGPIRVITSTHCLNPGRVLEVDVGWGTTAAPEQDFRVELALTSEDGEVSQVETFPLSPSWPASEWTTNAIAWGYYILRAHPSLPAGTYTLTLALVDPATGKIWGQQAVVGQVTVSPSPCTFDVPSNANSMNALFGDDLRLLGYQLRRDGGLLTLTLHWRSEQRMETDYKIFVHVFDPATAVPVAQDDAMPHRWAYPTTFWGPGEPVKDVIPISLEGMPAGTYGVAIGVYDPATVERLPVVDGAASLPFTLEGIGQLQPDGRLVLPGETVEIEGHGP